MTTFSTGNPIGSAAAKDLYDNAENLDEFVNSDSKLSHPDRFGVERKTWHGMEQDFQASQAQRDSDFQAFLASSGYQFLGDYAAGIEVTAYNQIIRESGEFWRLSAGTALPYTTTGAGMPEGGEFVSVGDAALRQDLIDPAQGGNLVRISTSSGTDQPLAEAIDQRVIHVDTISILKGLPLPSGVTVYLSQDGRAGEFISRSGTPPIDPNEGIYIPLNNGNYVERVDKENPSPLWFGASGDGVSDDEEETNDASGVESRTYFLQTADNPPLGVAGDFILTAPDRRADSSQALLTPPPGFSAGLPVLPIKLNGRWTADKAVESLIPASVGVTYYVHPLDGSDSNDGLAESTPLLRISTALSKPDVGLVYVAPQAVGFEDSRFGNIAPTTTSSHVILRAWKTKGHGRAVSSTALGHNSGNWTQESPGNLRTYSASISGTHHAVLDFSVLDSNGQPAQYVKRSSIAEVNVRPGTYWIDTGAGKIYINTFAGGVPGQHIQILRSGTNAYWNSSKPLYIVDFDFVGGSSSLWFPTDGGDVITHNCRFIAGNENNLTYVGSGTYINSHCETMLSRRDGFNYHIGATTAPTVVEINCKGISAGSEVGVDSHQCSTMHDGGSILRIGCEYDAAQTQLTADVNAGTKSWNVGTRYGTSRQVGGNNVAANIADGEGWFYDCDMGDSLVSLSASGSGVIYVHNSHPRGAAAGDIRSYRQR